MKEIVEKLQAVAMCLDDGGDISEDEKEFLKNVTGEALAAFIELTGFAQLKLRANACRVSGDLHAAKVLEHRAELHYKRIPKAYSW